MSKISSSTTVHQIFKKWPQTVELFIHYRMSCPGCYLAEFENLENALLIYNIPKEPFLERLQKIIAEGNLKLITKEKIYETLKQVLDPEIGVNIVDLGLIYQVDIRPDEVYIQLTMTSPACPLHGVITRNMDKVLRQSFPEIGEMTIELAWEPVWSPEMMSETAKKQLGWSN